MIIFTIVAYFVTFNTVKTLLHYWRFLFFFFRVVLGLNPGPYLCHTSPLLFHYNLSFPSSCLLGRQNSPSCQVDLGLILLPKHKGKMDTKNLNLKFPCQSSQQPEWQIIIWEVVHIRNDNLPFNSVFIVRNSYSILLLLIMYITYKYYYII